MKKYVKLFIGAILPCSFLIIGCKHGGESGSPTQGVLSSIPEYRAILIAPREITFFTDFPTIIQGQQNIEIRPKIEGYIDAIYVDEGLSVKKGQLLFRIKAPQYEQELRTAQATIKIAQADVNTAQMQMNKVRPLVEKNIISKYELESAQYNLESKQAALLQAQAQLTNAQTNLSYTAISSPVSGIVGQIPYKIGSLVNFNTQQPLTTVSNVSNIHAYFSIDEKQALQFSKNTIGRKISSTRTQLPLVSLILADGSEFRYKGKIENGSGIANTQTASFSFRAIFSNPENTVRSGSTGKVRIPQKVGSAIQIPQKATYELQGKRFVFLVEKDGTVKSTEIKTIENNDGQFYIVSKGLKFGDKIIVEGIANLSDGAKVKPILLNSDSLFTKIQ